jgi:hypothetical protein
MKQNLTEEPSDECLETRELGTKLVVNTVYVFTVITIVARYYTVGKNDGVVKQINELSSCKRLPNPEP